MPLIVVNKTYNAPPSLGPEKEASMVLKFAIWLSVFSFAYYFASSFVPKEYVNLDSIKSILPFLFTADGLLWGYYWGSSQGSTAKNKTIDTQIQNAATVAALDADRLVPPAPPAPPAPGSGLAAPPAPPDKTEEAVQAA